MRRLALSIALAAACAGAAGGVTVLDSTWKEEGGTRKAPAAGFGAHIALAHQPQFAAAITFSSDGD